MIKKITLLSLLVAFVAITGCKKEKVSEKNIVGKWTVTAVEEISYLNGKEVSRSNDLDGEFVFEFRSDGSGQDNTEGDINQFTYITTSETLSIKYPGEDPEVFNIRKLTSSELQINLEDTEEFNGQTYKEVVNISLKKK